MRRGVKGYDDGGSRGRGVTATLFVTLGLVAAFVVSMIARGLGEDDAIPAAVAARAIGDPAQVRVEVLNGAGTEGLARAATQSLRGNGFDVVYFGNAPSFDRGRSVVLDRVDDPGRARAVAVALGIDSVASAPDSTLLLDVSVVLGDDWPPVAPARRRLLERLRALVDRN